MRYYAEEVFSLMNFSREVIPACQKMISNISKALSNPIEFEFFN